MSFNWVQSKWDAKANAEFGMEVLLRLELKHHEDTESSPKGFSWTFAEFIKGGTESRCY